MLKKNKYFLLVLITICSFGFIYNPETMDTKKHSYVGAEKCGMCHKSDKQGKQLSIWQSSKHSKAFKTLQTAEADKIAKEKGFKTKAAETPECLQCHVSGHNVDASLKGPKFKVEDGVQCETCHGPGSDYQALAVMKDKAKAIANGLIVHDNKEKFCTGCHNSKSPTFKSFKFKEAWSKIAHDVPKS